MKTLKCKDIDPTLTCDFMATGVDDMEALNNMMIHAKEAHSDKIVGMSDEGIMDMMRPHIKEEAEVSEEAPAM